MLSSPSLPAAHGLGPRQIPLRPLVGYLAIAVTVLVWAGFALSTRAASGAQLTFGDVALIRSGIPALFFLPFLPKRIAVLRQLPARRWLMIAAGAGLPFFWLAAMGGAQTSATHVGALIAGTTPVSVAVLTWVIYRQRPAVMLPLGIILVGVAALIGASGNLAAGSLTGVALLLSASLFWGCYTLGLRGSGLDPIGCALVLALPSTLVLLPLLATGVLPSNLTQVRLAEAMPFILAQGVGVGLVSSLTYAIAIARLGVAKCAAIGSLAPAIAAVLAVPLLHEALTPGTILAVLIICAGVMLANRPKE
ncbi:DMT family transporter [Sulfitobacter pontiacus]|uniref:DMT family transporter n=1 Tax=Sulfitobacter pontiacus TaxID=60137 RepID=UPI00241ED473|nr:DMT family transporter [Sulfitobacter pontiacus]HJO51560.1 DMT family transporter [Sulfitobacter pontiacus]